MGEKHTTRQLGYSHSTSEAKRSRVISDSFPAAETYAGYYGVEATSTAPQPEALAESERGSTTEMAGGGTASAFELV